MSGSPATDRLALRILWGLGVGVVLGVILPVLGAAFPALMEIMQWVATRILDPFGQVFLRLLFFSVVPLVFTSLMLGVLQLGRLDQLASMGLRTFALFTLNMVVATALGLLVMNWFGPGNGIDLETRQALTHQFSEAASGKLEASQTLPAMSFAYFVDLFLPRNFLRAVVDFQLLPLILFALLMGAAGTQLPAEQRQRVRGALEIGSMLVTRLVRYALQLAPYAVPALIVSVSLKAGNAALQSLLFFVLCCLAVMAFHLFVTMSVLLKLFSSVSPRRFFLATRTILITAFSTSSSNATLPTTIQVATERLGVSTPTASFVLPLGATMNMSGTALYEGCVVLFLAQVYGVALSLPQQAMLVVLAVLSAVAVAGVPGGSLPLIVGLLVTFRIPAEAIALIIGVDRLLDMARTVVNVVADVVTAVIVDEKVKRPAGGAGQAGGD